MNLKWIGAVLVIAGCGGFGCSIAASYRAEQRMLRQLQRGLEAMRWELQYRLTPLPELCRLAGKETGGALGTVFGKLARALDRQVEPDAAGCMRHAMRDAGLSPVLRRLLLQLGRSLGRYDLAGQLQGIQAVEQACRTEEEKLEKDRALRLRSYRALSLCAGEALVILFN